MHTYETIDELMKYVDKNDDAKTFLNERKNQTLSLESFNAFIERYRKRLSTKKEKKFTGSAFSERVFAYWIMVELNKYGCNSLTVQRDENMKLRNNYPAHKKIDFFFEGKNGNVYIELKCCIDTLETDLYKFYLMKRCSLGRRYILILKVDDKGKKKSKGNNGYISLLEDAKTKAEGEHESLLEDYFYFAGTDVEEKITRFQELIKNHV